MYQAKKIKDLFEALDRVGSTSSDAVTALRNTLNGVPRSLGEMEVMVCPAVAALCEATHSDTDGKSDPIGRVVSKLKAKEASE